MNELLVHAGASLVSFPVMAGFWFVGGKAIWTNKGPFSNVYVLVGVGWTIVLAWLYGGYVTWNKIFDHPNLEHRYELQREIVYDQIRVFYYRLPPERQSEERWASICQEIERYNSRVVAEGLRFRVPTIDTESIGEFLKHGDHKERLSMTRDYPASIVALANGYLLFWIGAVIYCSLMAYRKFFWLHTTNGQDGA